MNYSDMSIQELEQLMDEIRSVLRKKRVAAIMNQPVKLSKPTVNVPTTNSTEEDKVIKKARDGKYVRYSDTRLQAIFDKALEMWQVVDNNK